GRRNPPKCQLKYEESTFFLFQFRCTNCGESRDYWQYVVVNEVLDIPGSRGEANLVEKCKLCNRMSTVSIVKDSLGSYSSTEHNEEWQSMIQLDCRGLEPIDFDFRVSPEFNLAKVGTGSSPPQPVAALVNQREICYHATSLIPGR
ncbi:unnamed protein product, partial [Angiostrongylus costaricensis]|uniref:CXXC motif containing zinc binding protein n=1 Tax=Angiostrongylus costaricensis TaxID=334426 RepID=A0A0R3PJ88_ANGCS